MRVLMTGGGTGGHVYPAFAIAEIIKANHPDSEIAFVGTEKGIENSLVPNEGYKLYHIKIQGIRRSFSPSNIKTAYYVMTSPSRAKKIIKEFSPDIVIGTGGYVCWPLLRAASSMNIPTLVHESNAFPGVAVRQLKTRVDAVLTNFESTGELLGDKSRVINVGNPLRRSCSVIDKASARKKLDIPDNIKTVILSFGGSLGAARINQAAIDVMKGFSSGREDVMHFHSGGSRGYENAKVLFAGYGLERNERLVMSNYIYDMPTYMAAADIVICRAGAMTLTELAVMGKAAILIPSPNVTDNHQYKNAKQLQDGNGAVLIEESELTAELIVEKVKEMADNDAYRHSLEENVRKFAKEDVEKNIYNVIKELVNKK